MESEGLLQKVCNILDDDGLLVEQYKTRVLVTPVGTRQQDGRLSVSAPSLWRRFTYDDAGNRVAEVPEVREWTQACEDAAQGSFPDDGDNVINIAKSAVKYEYAEAASVPIGSTVTLYSKQLLPDEYLFLRHVSVGGDCIAKFQVVVNGTPIATKRTWWTRWDTDFWFNTSNGGIIYQNEELIQVVATNQSIDEMANFEVSVGLA